MPLARELGKEELARLLPGLLEISGLALGKDGGAVSRPAARKHYRWLEVVGVPRGHGLTLGLEQGVRQAGSFPCLG